MTYTDIPSLITRIFKENLRLVVKEGASEDCDCIWMVKPGSIEECARKAAEALTTLTAFPLPREMGELCGRLYHRRTVDDAPDVDCINASAIIGAQYRKIESLTASPLPDEVARLAEFLKGESVTAPEPCADEKYWCSEMATAASLLEQQARENGVLGALMSTREFEIAYQSNRIRELEAGWSAQSVRAEKAEAGLGELEAELNTLKADRLLDPVRARDLEIAHESIRELEAERDALKDDLRFADARNRELLGVRAKTIEECAQLAENEGGDEYGPPPVVTRIAREIRALSQPAEAGKE